MCMSVLSWEQGAGLSWDRTGALLSTAVMHRRVCTTPLRLQELTTDRAPSPAEHLEQQLTTLVVALAGT